MRDVEMTIMTKATMDNFLKNGKGLLLAYDQGFEHGPSTDFNEKNIDPNYVLDIAVKGQFTGVVLHKGIAEKYYISKIPLIIKLNGKTSLPKGEPISSQVCSVEEAISLGAKGVGYTIYLGSANENIMLQEFGEIQEDAHEEGVPAIAWIYPRGEAVENDTSAEIVSYAARAGLEIGADAVKIKYSGDPTSFRWAVKAAGLARVFMSGGPKAPTDETFLNQVKGAMDAGATGLAVGRNVWQHADPLKMSSALREIIVNGKDVERGLQGDMKGGGGGGVSVNALEKRSGSSEVAESVKLCADADLRSLVCADTTEYSVDIAKMLPDMIAIEPPELIGTGISVSKARPELITESVKQISKVDGSVKIRCCAGVTTAEDVSKALELGSEGVLVASGVVKSKDPKTVLQI